MNKSDPLSEEETIPLGHNHTNGAVYSGINVNVEICSALYIFDGHPMLQPISLILSVSKILSLKLISSIPKQNSEFCMKTC